MLISHKITWNLQCIVSISMTISIHVFSQSEAIRKFLHPMWSSHSFTIYALSNELMSYSPPKWYNLSEIMFGHLGQHAFLREIRQWTFWIDAEMSVYHNLHKFSIHGTLICCVVVHMSGQIAPSKHCFQRLLNN